MSNIGKEYGTALFMLAHEQNMLPACADGMQTVGKTFIDHPAYPELLASPNIPLSERLAALQTAFAEAVPDSVLSFLQLLCEKGRINSFFEAANEYQNLLNAHDRIAKATVTSAVALTDAEKEKLRLKLEQLSHGKIELTYTIDPALLGGLIIEWDGKVLDGSLRQRLRDIKDVMNT